MSTDDTGSRLLSRLLERDLDLEKAFERLVAMEHPIDENSAVRMVVPPELLTTGGEGLPELIESVLAEYGEIEALLDALREHEGAADGPMPRSNAIAFVSERELADPESLARVLEPLQSESAKFEFLFAQAKAILDRLAVYQLSREPSTVVLAELRERRNLMRLQYVVEFLRGLRSAADSFEALDIPGYHIRDYLTYLYQMKDWREMERLVYHLEIAVGKLFEAYRRQDDPTAPDPAL